MRTKKVREREEEKEKVAGEADAKKGRNMILIPSNRDPHKSRSSCLAELYPVEQKRQKGERK